MKSILRIVAIVMAVCWCGTCIAQSNGEITLTVSSDGPTKDDAIKNALRTAIEQAYGAFVSANTTILNDDLVKDEIVTISTGAIKEYSILSDAEKADGSGFMVTTKATVSLPHLIKYAQNHGSECEFAGNTFGMQMKLKELRMVNEEKALENLITEVKSILPAMISWEMEMESPKEIGYDRGLENANDYYEVPVKFYVTTFAESDTYSNRTTEVYSNRKIPDFYSDINMRDKSLREPQISQFGELLSTSLEGIALTKSESEMYENSNTRIEHISNPKYEVGKQILKFTNPKAGQLVEDLYNEIGDMCCDFVILDNLGNRHDFYLKEIRHLAKSNGNRYAEQKSSTEHLTKSEGRYVSNDAQSFSNMPFEIYNIESTYRTYAHYETLKGINTWYECLFPGLFYSNEKREKRMPVCELRFLIPKKDIGKYSSFKVVRKE